MTQFELARALDLSPSSLEVQATAGVFLAEINRLQDTGTNRDTAIRCALAAFAEAGKGAAG